MAEIEVEKKFLLTDDQEKALLNGADFNKEKHITDSYFDNAEYSLTTADFWLRLRDGAFELKAPLSSGSGSYEGANRYQEITDEAEIAKKLNLPADTPLANELGKRGISEFITCYTTRQSYSKQGFAIDLDAATYKDSSFTYSVAEVELLVEDESMADAAEARIIEFAKQHNLTMGGVILGKIAAWLETERPAHYQTLVAAGVLK